MQQRIAQIFEQSVAVKQQAAAVLGPQIERAVILIIASLRDGGKVALCGNGGSAADAQHVAGELVGRYLLERQGLAAIALTTDTSILTAIGNDYGFDQVFVRQVEGLLRPGDVLVALSTSGNAENVVAAARAAREQGVTTIGMTGADGGKLASAVDVCLQVPSDDTPRIQETHITIGHIICELVEAALAETDGVLSLSKGGGGPA